jgi:hypothetical protein
LELGDISQALVHTGSDIKAKLQGLTQNRQGCRRNAATDDNNPENHSVGTALERLA